MGGQNKDVFKHAAQKYYPPNTSFQKHAGGYSPKSRSQERGLSGPGEQESGGEEAVSPRMQAEDHLDGRRRHWRHNFRKSVTQQIFDVFEYFERSVESGDNK